MRSGQQLHRGGDHYQWNHSVGLAGGLACVWCGTPAGFLRFDHCGFSPAFAPLRSCGAMTGPARGLCFTLTGGGCRHGAVTHGAPFPKR